MSEPTTPARRLEEALYFGRADVIDDLARRHPGLAASSLALQVATYDVEGVEARLMQDPAAAVASAPRRQPIAHLCFSRYHEVVPERRDAMLEVARILVEHGADVNATVPVGPDEPGRLSMLYGALRHARNVPLARWLLEHGASPNDRESLYHATELGHADGVALLLQHGADPTHTNALLRAIDMDDVAMVTMLLDAGADPDDPHCVDTEGRVTPSPPATWHAARRRASASVVEALVAHGADLSRVWEGRDAFGTACVLGAVEAASVLRRHGAARPLIPHEALLADCVGGVEPPAGARVDPTDLTPSDAALPHALAAVPGSVPALRHLFQVGFDPAALDDQGMPALHVAAWEGVADATAFLLTLPHDLAHRNVYGGDVMGTVIHGAEFCPAAASRDHVACARLLLAAGAVPNPADVEACGAPDLVRLLRART